MIIDNFFNSLPSDLLDLVYKLNKLDFKVGFVGGSTRDYFLNNTISKDFDCELRPINNNELENQWKKLYQFLKNEYVVEKLNYNVLRITTINWIIELTYPRLEKFNGGNGHSNFEVIFIPDNDYNKGFVRRDFTINAVLFEKYFEELSIYDPLNGIKHLNEKLLVPCSDDFSKDPVRFLRAIRFKIKLRFEFSTDLLDCLKNQDLSGISKYYLNEEIQKSQNAIEMFVELLEFKKSIFLNENDFYCCIEEIKKLANFFNGSLNDLLQVIGLLSEIDLDKRKALIKSLGHSIKKYSFLEKYDFSKLSNIEKKEESYLSDETFKAFCKFVQIITKIEKIKSNDDFVKFILEKYNILNLDVEKFRKICFQNLSLDEKEMNKFLPSQYGQLIIAKKYLSLCE